VRRDDEVYLGCSQAFGEFVKLVDREDHTEVRDGHVVSVHWIAYLPAGRCEVRHDLVPFEVPVDPLVGTAALDEPQDSTVEASSCVEIIDRNGEVKPGYGRVGA
jgi:hypothetical protein